MPRKPAKPAQPAMRIERMALADLKPDPKNARKHNKRNLDAIRKSLDAFGQAQVIVFNKRTGMLVGGHGTVQVMQDRGDTHAAVHVVDLPARKASALGLALNRTAELAEWDEDVLSGLLRDLDDPLRDIAGFTVADVSKILGAAVVVEDDVPPVPKKATTKPGDLWLLGEHRLLCGDSTKADDVGRVMNGQKVALVFTDPPYGVDFQSNMRTATPKFAKLANDDKILDAWVPLAKAHSAGWVFVWTAWKVLQGWLPVVAPFGTMSNMVVWHKGGGGIGDLKGTFATDYEVALVFNRGAELCGKRIGSVWSFGKDGASTYQHPTQKPVALAAEAIEKTTRHGVVVMDVFLGSGTTLIAAEQLGRKCYGLEIEPAYCDVICQRWSKLTGKQPVLETRDA